MQNIHKIRTLTDRFFLGETSPSEEQKLYWFFAAHRDSELPADLRPLRQMFADYGSMSDEASTEAPATTVRHATRRWLIAATAAIAIVGGITAMIWSHTESTTPPEDDMVAIFYGETTTDPTLVMEEMQRTMAAMTAADGDIGQELRDMFLD